MNRQEIQRDAIDYFTDFFEKEMLKARKEVEGDL